MPEIMALCKVVAEFGGVVSAHIRDEGDDLAKSVAEFIEIIRQSGDRGVISHHKAMTRSENWGKGLIREGFDADICIFYADKIIDKSEYADCNNRAEGLSYVIIGGKIAVENAVFTGEKGGKAVLKK